MSAHYPMTPMTENPPLVGPPTHRVLEGPTPKVWLPSCRQVARRRELVRLAPPSLLVRFWRHLSLRQAQVGR